MELMFITQMTKEELKAFLLGIVKEAMADGGVGKAPDTANEQMVSVAEAAKITGLAMNTLYDKTHRREIPHYKKGKRLYFRPAELIAWIANGRVMTRNEIEAKAISHVMGQPLTSKKRKEGAKGK